MSNEDKVMEEGLSQSELIEKATKLMKRNAINNEVLDVLGEMGNISMGAAATNLSSILGQKVLITSPKVDVVDKEVFKSYIKKNEVMLDVKYTKGIEADNYLLIDKKTTKKISSIMMGGMTDGDDDNIGEMELSAVQEAMNQMMGRAATAMSDLFEKAVDITPPGIKQLTDEDVEMELADGYVRIIFDLLIGEEIQSQIVQMLLIKQAVGLAKELKGEEVKPKKSFQDLSKMLKKIEKDALGEIANISFGTASTFLSEVLNQKVSITTPKIEIVDRSGLNKIEIPSVMLNVDYVEGLNTENILIIKKQTAAAIANLMLGGDGIVGENPDIGEMELSAVQEAMNQMMGNSATAMSEMFQRVVDISPPVVKLIESEDDLEWIDESVEEYFVKITFDLLIGNLVKSQLVQAIAIDEAKKMAAQLLELTGKGVNEEVKEEEKNVKLEIDGNNVSPITKRAKLEIDVVFGNSIRKLEELLSLHKGDVLKLIENVDAPLKIMANNIHVGYGNIVNVGERFAVEIVSLIEE